MEIGTKIKALRTENHLTQQDLADAMGVSVQTVSRWENSIHYPDLTLIPQLARFFHVTADNLLGMKGEPKMAKLMKTTEEFLVSSKEEAQSLIQTFQADAFPRLISYKMEETCGGVTLTVQKEFGAELDQMKFGR